MNDFEKFHSRSVEFSGGGGMASGLLMGDFQIVAAVTIYFSLFFSFFSFIFSFDVLFDGPGPFLFLQSIGFRQDVDN